MHLCRNLFFLLAGMSFLSACSTLQNAQSLSGQPSSTTHTEKSEKITFINDIHIRREGHVSTQNVKGYHSPTLSMGVESPSIAIATGLQQKYGQMLGVPPQDIDDSSLYSFINSWYGTPYLYGGDSRDGIDCSAFVQLLYGVVFGIVSLPRTAQEQFDDSKKIRHLHKLKEGDLVFFHIRSRRINHVGVYLQNGKFVSACVSAGVMVCDLSDPYWKRYFAGGGVPDQVASANDAVASSN